MTFATLILSVQRTSKRLNSIICLHLPAGHHDNSIQSADMRLGVGVHGVAVVGTVSSQQPRFDSGRGPFCVGFA